MTTITVLSAEDLQALVAAAVTEGLERFIQGMLTNPHGDGAQVLTINQLRKRYGIGRQQLKRLIVTGELPATERVMRGGHRGFVVRVADAERVLAGGVGIAQPYPYPTQD